MGTGYSGIFGYGISDWSWATKFAWLPARMGSGRYVWLREYYHGVRFIHGPAGESPVVLHQYMTPQEYLFKALKSS
jgi:hypothetical protein